jgi:2-aminoethylphosphonate-pyruvate transaminase
MRPKLLNPGPVSLSDGVRRAAIATDLCHREPEFSDLQDRIRSKLTGIYELASNAWCPVLLPGSGTTALEAMLSSLLPRNGRLLVLENGVYGERLTRLAGIHGVDVQVIRHGWLEAWDLQGVARALATGGFTHVAAVHHETTCGRLNPADQLARLCEQNGVELLLDTVSSFAAEPIPFHSPALAACAVTANKCLHGIPGLCFVVLRREALVRIATPPRTLTLDLALWADHQDRRSTPFTPPVNSMLALDQALDELAKEGGWHVRHSHYHHLAERVERCLAALGIHGMLAADQSSCVLRAYRLPAGKTYQQVHDALKQRGFVIYSGQGSLVNEMFRISTMGDIADFDMERLLAALEIVFT